MSFSTDVKKELLALENISDCCRHAEAYGLFLFGRSFSGTGVSFAAEYHPVSERYAQYVRDILGIEPEYTAEEGKMAIVNVPNSSNRKAVLAQFGHSTNEPSLRINRANLSDDCCFAAFLRGVFLSCGTVSTPEKNYHMEFTVPFYKLSGDLCALLEELDYHPRMVMRKSCRVIYFKESEIIEELLTLMGATGATLQLMGVKIDKDMRNNVNRRINFDTANIDRSVKAGGTQTDAIRKIVSKKGMDFLSPALQEVAKLRLDNPEASLQELEDLLDGTLSRSGINHRLKRLMAIANEID